MRHANRFAGKIRLYARFTCTISQSSGVEFQPILARTCLVFSFWLDTNLIGIGVRGVVYRALLQMDGAAAIERNVRLRFADHIQLRQRRLSG